MTPQLEIIIEPQEDPITGTTNKSISVMKRALVRGASDVQNKYRGCSVNVTHDKRYVTATIHSKGEIVPEDRAEIERLIGKNVRREFLESYEVRYTA